MKEKEVDPFKIRVVDHVLIRDKDSKKVLVNKRGENSDPTKALHSEVVSKSVIRDIEK